MDLKLNNEKTILHTYKLSKFAYVLSLSAEYAMLIILVGYVEFESDSLNEHECMASFTNLLQHMLRNNITPSVADEVLCHYLHKQNQFVENVCG